jgi:protein-arginine kinase activator protein McsA
MSKELNCPKCEEILDDFVLNERSRCASCGTEVGELLTILQTQLEVAEGALKNIRVVITHNGTINEVLRIVLEVL